MLKMTYDAIQPTLALRLAKMTHKHTNEVRDLIDDMVGESLSSERKHDIVLEHNLDFTFENLLELTTLALFEAYSDEHDVWDEEKNKLIDPSLLEDKKEGDEGIDDEPYMPDVYGIDPYPHRHEFIDNDCIICDYVLKATENMIYDENGVWQPKPEERMFTNGSIMALQSHFEELEGYKSHEGGVTLCKICNNLFDTYSKFSDHYQTHSKKEQGMERDHSKPYTDKFGKRHVSWTCPKCGEEFGIAGHSGEGERFEHIMSHESKATEGRTLEQTWNYSNNQERYDIMSAGGVIDFIELTGYDEEFDYDELPNDTKSKVDKGINILFSKQINWLGGDTFNIKNESTEGESNLWAGAFRSTRSSQSIPIFHIVKEKNGIGQSLCGVYCDTSNAKVDATYTEFGKTFESDKCKKCLRLSGYESKATEGGRGSGRKGHQKWMLGAEADPEECPNCMIFTEKKNGNCQICGNSY